ncbi:MAG TPA: hypothetical protein VGF86_05165 [Candidatus Tumulicola sp.]
MKLFVILALVGLAGQTATPNPARELTYRFGYNTRAAASGPGTGTTTIDIVGPAADGGVMVNATDTWWNSVRPRATNTCEVYANGGVSCMDRPYAISPIQLAIFPLLGRNYFSGLNAAGTSTWTCAYQVKRGDLYQWNATFTLTSKGPASSTGSLILINSRGTMDQLGGRYRQGTASGTIVYDAAARVPVIVSDVRSHLPQTTVNNQDGVDLRLTQDSQPH